jgi:hypothetical protein
MPRPRQRQQLTPPSEEDIARVVRENLEVVAVAPTLKGQFLFIKMISKENQEIIFYIDPIRADYMRRMLQEALPPDGGGGSPTTWATGASPRAYGSVPRSTV